MEYRRMGNTGLLVSELGFGTATFGWHTSASESTLLLDTYVEAGGNFIDTADVYSRGRSEEMIGNWLSSSANRHNLVIATKCGMKTGPNPNDQGLSRRHIIQAVEGSLRRLRTDYIDLYQTHSMDTNTPIEETLIALNDLVRSGKTRYLGCSNYSSWRLIEALWKSDSRNISTFQCLQPRYNLLQRTEFETDMAELVANYQLGVIPYSPLAGGTLTGKYKDPANIPEGTRAAETPSMRRYHTPKNLKAIKELAKIGTANGKTTGQTAIAWLLSNPLITAPILGARNYSQLQETLGATGYRLRPKEISRLNELTD